LCWCDAEGQGRDSGQRSRCVVSANISASRELQLTACPAGNRITPSYVAFTDEERLVGDAAKNQAAANPFRTIFDIKRLIGRKFSEKEVQTDIKHFPYKYVQTNMLTSKRHC
jgi:heat shock protein 5